MRSTLISIFLITFTLFIGALVYRVDDLMFADKLSWSEAQSRSQMAPLLQALESQLANESETLALTYSQIQDLKNDYAKSSGLAKFQMVSVLKNPGGKDWSFEKSLFLEKAPIKSWAPSYLSLLLKNVDSKDVKPGAFAAYTLLDPERKSYVFLLHQMVQSVENNEVKQTLWFGVLLGPEFFQNLMDRSKGQVSQVFLVNNLGQALGHSVPEYVGHLLSEDPLVGEVMKSQLGSGSGIFRDLKGESVQGFYEQVPKSNITAVVTTPLAALLKSRDEVRLQLVLVGLGLAFLGTALFVVLYRPEKQIVRVPSGQTQATGLQTIKAPVTVVGSPMAASSNEDLQKERMKAFVQVSSALAHEMRGPMTSLLGHASLLKKSAGGSDHLSSIEEMARKSDEILKKLLAFAGEGAVKPEKIILKSLLEKVLKNFEPTFFRKGIVLHKSLESSFEITASPLTLAKAFESLLQNSVEALERNSKKEIHVRLKDQGASARIEIQDSGDGIEPQQMDKIFDPFFSTRKGHAGLGLSMAHGIFRELGSELSLQSERGQGTTVAIVLHPTADVAPAAEVAAPEKPMAVSPATAKAFDLKIPDQKSVIELEDQEVNQVLDMELGDQSDPLSEKKIEDTQVLSLPPIPREDLTVALEAPEIVVASPVPKSPPSKIDKPQFKRQVAEATELDFQIRKPGAKI